MLKCVYKATAHHLCRSARKGTVLIAILGLSIFNIPISSRADSVVQKESVPILGQNKSKKKEPQTNSTGDETSARSEDADSMDGLTMLYIGGAVAGVAVLAVALGAGSSTSDSNVPPPELPDIPVVGPDLRGTDWAGNLNIKDRGQEGFQAISASIAQRGSAVQIDTSSTLDYGRQFKGTISSSGYMLMYDSITGEDWTTLRGNATASKVGLYDYVNNFDDLDTMYLSR